MSWSVTFGNTTLLASTGGVFSFRRGLFTPAYDFRNPPRTTGDYAAYLSTPGADHLLVITLLEVARSAVSSTITTMEGLALPTSGVPTTATLTIPDMDGNAVHTLTNCLLYSVEYDPEELRAVLGNDGNMNEAPVYDMQFTLKFRQLRR